jgi:xylose isomerase
MNFDAHVRRQSIDPVDLFYAHIGGWMHSHGIEDKPQT